MEFDINISPLTLAYSKESIQELKLMSHQSELRHCNERFVMLDAPTSSGKTLAYLLRAIESFQTTIILYPTNALMWDQAHAIRELLEKRLHKRVLMGVEEIDGKISWSKEIPPEKVDVNLFVVNGESLAALAEESETSEGKAFHEKIKRTKGRLLVLTNMEILYLLYEQKFVQSELIERVLYAREGISRESGSLLVVDEFHLYFGASLATLLYLIHLLKGWFTQVIFTSATAHPLHPLEEGLGEKVHRIHYLEGDGSGRTVRHPIELRLVGIPNIILKDEQITHFLSYVQSFRDPSLAREADTVQVVGILNSVTSTARACKILREQLKEKFANEVTEIHGLIPGFARVRDRMKFCPIVIGTSAIEVGIDFDTQNLVFEAHDSSSFIQRLGRGGRKRRCKVVAFIPEMQLIGIKNAVANKAEISVKELGELVEEFMNKNRSYSSFSSSKGGLYLFLSILMGVRLYQKVYRVNNGQHFTQVIEDLKKMPAMIPPPLRSFATNLEDIGYLSIFGRLSQNVSGRSSLKSLPSVFKEYNNAVDYVSLGDLPKLEFKVADKAEAQRITVIPRKMRKQDIFLIVSHIKDNPDKLYILSNKQTKTPITTSYIEDEEIRLKFGIKSDSGSIEAEKAVSEVLKGQVYYRLATEPPDWRITGLYGSGDFFAFGSDALLAWEISRGYRSERCFSETS